MSADMINSGTIYKWTNENGAEVVELWSGEKLKFKKISDAKLYLSGIEKGVSYYKAAAFRLSVVQKMGVL